LDVTSLIEVTRSSTIFLHPIVLCFITMMWINPAFHILFLPLLACSFTFHHTTQQRSHHVLCMINENEPILESHFRRNILFGSLLVVPNLFLVAPGQDALAVERAVGAAEKACREAGNCLERGDLDAAVGWNWGGKDRCDATDPKCGPNGILLETVPTGEPIPTVTNKITHQVELSIIIGKGETGTLKLGLYGDDTPQSVQQLLDFLSPNGLVTTTRLMLDERYGSISQGVSLLTGGLLTGIAPSQRLLFGVPSQAAAYARSNGLSKAGDNFLPQPRPQEQLTYETSVRLHDCAGLVSIPGGGLGYANNGKDDEAYANGKSIWGVLVHVFGTRSDKNSRHALPHSIPNYSVGRTCHGQGRTKGDWSSYGRTLHGVFGTFGTATNQ
jgi:hypothetical protein